MHSELSLLARMKNGDEEAFACLYRRHKDAVYRYRAAAHRLAGRRRGRHAGDVPAPDAAPGAVRPRARLGRGLAVRHRAEPRAARDRAARGCDRSRDFADGAARPAPSLDTACPAQQLLASETAEQVRAALSTLAPHYRDVLILCELSELSYAEAAQVCGIDIGTVRSRLSRARAQLAARLSHLGLVGSSGRLKEAS